jgi:hypothetical protein
MGIKWAAGKVSSFYLDCGNLAAAIIDTKNQFFGIRSFIDIYFAEGDAAFPKELLNAAAVATPRG